MEGAEIQVFASHLEDVPPAYLCVNGTPDQNEHWLKIKEQYVALKELLTAHFSGAEYDLSKYEPIQKEYYLLDRDYWIAFYRMICDAWQHIKAIAQEHNISLVEHDINTPGLMLAAAIEDSAKFHVSPAYVPYLRRTPSETRKDLKLFREADQLLAAKGRSLTNKENQTLKQAERRRKQIRSETQKFTGIEVMCLTACERQMDERTRKNLKAFKEASADVQAFCYRHFLHPSKRIKGYEWRNGSKSYMDKYGGKPVNKTSR